MTPMATSVTATPIPPQMQPGGKAGQQPQAADQQGRMQRVARLVGTLAVASRNGVMSPIASGGRAGQCRAA